LIDHEGSSQYFCLGASPLGPLGTPLWSGTSTTVACVYHLAASNRISKGRTVLPAVDCHASLSPPFIATISWVCCRLPKCISLRCYDLRPKTLSCELRTHLL